MARCGEKNEKEKDTSNNQTRTACINNRGFRRRGLLTDERGGKKYEGTIRRCIFSKNV